MEDGYVRLVVGSKALNDQAAESFRRAKLTDNALLPKTRLKRIKFSRACAPFHLRRRNRIILAHQEDQARDVPFDRAVILHFSNGNVVAIRNIAIAEGKD